MYLKFIIFTNCNMGTIFLIKITHNSPHCSLFRPIARFRPAFVTHDPIIHCTTDATTHTRVFKPRCMSPLVHLSLLFNKRTPNGRYSRIPISPTSFFPPYLCGSFSFNVRWVSTGHINHLSSKLYRFYHQLRLFNAVK